MKNSVNIYAALLLTIAGISPAMAQSGPTMQEKYHSFASGHTAATSAFFVALILARRRIGLALLPIPALIAFSRLYLNAHYLSDVVCAAFLGIGCAILAWRLIRRWEVKARGSAPSAPAQ